MLWVVYVDMDAFYVACELRDRPDLKGRPVIVGPDPKLGPTRGVVLSASYEARAFGVRSALPVGPAARLCPSAVWIAADFPKYERVSDEVLGRLARFAADVRPFSIDEAAFTVEADGAVEVERLARSIQQDLGTTLNLPATIGAAPNRLVAKIATDAAKPAGVRVVGPEDVPAFLAPLPVRAIPGIGPKTEERLRAVGVERIGQLAETSRATLVPVLGAMADEYRRVARGQYVDPPDSASGPRSRSVEETFESDLADLEPVDAAAGRLARDLARALSTERLRYQTVTIAVRWADFARVQRSRTLSAAREGPGDLEAVARRLVRELWTAERGGRQRAVRMLSVGAERLTPARTRSLPLDAFDEPPRTVK
jgi:nucleotidyltransferase/DNA polymerase involved in DNA repair